ncbi:tyrosine transporter [Candidatus Aerophobetes bacterium]|uniref:Tyrosine transporter n=1 Tax=Aerophobetes bacterium TaxID=2030807 RepID=A0A2A4WYF7_UNCAE|nr:MAG: tyrosine transporter [Candidatus Aerophobetes bacterium]
MGKSKLLGSVLIVMGTTIGGGVLALPITTGFMGFFPSMVLFTCCWLVMLLSAFCFLDVNLSFKMPVNLISMTQVLLGRFAKGICFVIYLFLLYSLVSAYLSGSVTLFVDFFSRALHLNISKFVASLCLPALFCVFIYLGTKGVDFINRILMLGLFVSFALLVSFIPEFVEGERLLHMDVKSFGIALPLVITSFGYHIVIPSLVTYVHHDRALLKKAIIIGSVSPLILYIIWQALVMGAVPLSGNVSLASAWVKGESVTVALSKIIHRPEVAVIGQFAVFFAIITSFLGVTMSLSDFVTDGFKLKRNTMGRFFSMLIALIPPLIFTAVSARGFIAALEYAGAFVAILLIFFPALLAWKLPRKAGYHTPLKRLMLIGLMAFAVFVVAVDILVETGFFKSTMQVYL